MSPEEVQVLLRMIGALDRKPFPEGAEVAWHLVLEHVELDHAIGAVKRHYSASNPRPITPGDVRVTAINERDRAARDARRALPPAPVTCENRAARVAEISTMLAEKFGNLERPAPSRRERPDVDSPIREEVDPEEFERRRAAALKLLESRSFAEV